METFTDFKKLTKNPVYPAKRATSLLQLDYSQIDSPLIRLIKKLNTFPFCYTLQCCYGHFLYPGQTDIENLDPIPQMDHTTQIDYRIAYVALCVENSKNGKQLLGKLKSVTQIDSKYIQFGCAGWFWKKYVNSYALQVEPERYKTKDRVFLKYNEALYVERVRNRFFEKLNEIFIDK